ncbi:hypothetical protein FMUND_12399 [Fusarium mundagurra]|uniref:Uncharacterized protein n=1 Tax=Fusarium mundagurra TaxID=1567541 RepID=A0A8H5Y3W1_9HYPO|nr:hypothetical protein FMUND_12399 [Fusarium mundagurra]
MLSNPSYITINFSVRLVATARVSTLARHQCPDTIARPPDPIRPAFVESGNEALNYSTRNNELTSRIAMNRESLSRASFGMAVATVATRSSNFHKTSVADGYKREIAQLRLKVTAWEDTYRKGEIRCPNGIEQAMMERHWPVKYLRGIDDKINCLRDLGCLLNIMSSGVSCLMKTLAGRNIWFVGLADHI